MAVLAAAADAYGYNDYDDTFQYDDDGGVGAWAPIFALGTSARGGPSHSHAFTLHC
jgi:hypothetical protein